MKNKAVQTIETGAIFSFQPLEIIEQISSVIPKTIIKKRTKLQGSSLNDEQHPYQKQLKQNKQLKLRQLYFPNIKIQEKPQISKRKDRHLSIQQNFEQISNCIMKLRRYSYCDFISKTDRKFSQKPTQSLVTSRAEIKYI
ncbi:unnamed protein product [Paramecium sonneborni]|uniref:Uncharacterized protein n=1 Tax=Paramecium sonneborni TaxID=65129 RepID=A0A8S1QDV0_9CILI|nr:unnamed protein product [Paramecium sonneborni]